MSKHPSLRPTGLGGVFKSLTKSLKPATGGVPVVINAQVVGGGPDMQKLLLQLQHGTLPSRASAAAEITEALERYSISSIPEVWYLARDMCDHRVQSSTRRVALKLMIQCIKHDEEAVSNKLMFFKDITRYCLVSETRLDTEFDLFLKALRTLTNDGRAIHDLYIYDQDQSWGDFVLACFYVLGKTAKDSSESDDKANQNLLKLTLYLSNCFKFNFGLLDELYVTSIIQFAVSTAVSVDNQALSSSFVEFFKVVVVFGHMPPAVLGPVIELLCCVSTNSGDQDALVWDILKHICFESSFLVLTKLCELLQNSNLQQYQSTDLAFILSKAKARGQLNCIATSLGAMSMIEKLFVYTATNHTISELDYAYDFAIEAIMNCLAFDIAILNTGLLRMIDRLFNQNDYLETYSSDTKFSVLFPLQVWYSSTTSIFQVLAKFKLPSTQDKSYWTSICTSLFERHNSNELMAPEERLVELFLKHPQYIPEDVVEFILQYYTQGKLCSLLNPLWKENCRSLLDCFYYNIDDLSSQQRINTLKTIKNGYDVSLTIFDDYAVSKDIVLEVLRKSFFEKDPEVVDYLMNGFLFGFLLTSSPAFFQGVLEVFGPIFQLKPKVERIKSIVSLSSFGSMPHASKQPSITSEFSYDNTSKTSIAKYLSTLAKAITKAFIVFSTKDAAKSIGCYNFIIEMLLFSIRGDFTEVLVILLRGLIRIRLTAEGYVYFTKIRDLEGLATAFRRCTLDAEYVANEDHLWTYPEDLSYLPVEYFELPSRELKLFDPNSAKLVVGSTGGVALDISSWIYVAISILEDYMNWELYSFVWAHFCPQLCNMRLFENQTTLILRLQRVVCDQLMLNLPRSLAFPVNTNVTKADLQVVFIRTLSSLLGYHDLFKKAEEDQIVSALLYGLGSWEKTAVPCIHILNICCYEIPLSIKKYLSAILTRLQTGVTSAFASTPTLEFLMSLIDLPLLTTNFTMDEFKRVFAICFKYIQYAGDLKSRVSKATHQDDKNLLQSHGVDAEVDKKASTKATTITPILNEYLLIVSFLVILRWFLKIDVNERRQVSGYLIKNVILSRSNDSDELDDPTIAFMDLISHFTYSDLPLKMIVAPRRGLDPQRTVLNRWIIGYTILCIETDTVTGNSTFIIRRPMGVSVFNVLIDPAMLPISTEPDGSKTIALNGYMLLQFCNHLDMDNNSKPLPLFDDAATERAINTLDRIPVMSYHKAGMIYIGPNQKEEVEILANSVGSREYQSFLDGVGQLISLKDCESIYVGGLDKENGTDGEYAYYWGDQTLQLIFHTTTIMPNMANDKYYSLKKRHIGNNHVNVYFDESGLPFNFNIIKSQFNFLNIVVSPHTLTKSVAGAQDGKFYKVKTYRRSGVPGIFSTTHFKLISAEQLPVFVRNVVIMSDRFAHVWHNSNHGEYTTNWVHRVRQIQTLRGKTEQAHHNLQEEQETHITDTANPDVTSSNMTQSFLEQLQPSAAAAPINATASKYEYITKTDKKLYSRLEFNSYT